MVLRLDDGKVLGGGQPSHIVALTSTGVARAVKVERHQKEDRVGNPRQLSHLENGSERVAREEVVGHDHVVPERRAGVMPPLQMLCPTQ